MSKPTIAIDFDGVMNAYNGWKGDDELFEPRLGLREFLAELYSDYRIVVHSTRPKEKIEEWLIKHELGLLINRVTSYKPVAIAYIDDRSIRFEGNFKDTLSFIKSDKIKTFWELEKEKREGEPNEVR